MSSQIFDPCLLKELRKQKGLTQERLAKRARVSRACVSMVEAGKMNPSLKLMCSLAGALGVEVSEFFATIEKNKEPKAKIPTVTEIESCLTEFLEGTITAEKGQPLPPETERNIREVLMVVVRHIQMQKMLLDLEQDIEEQAVS